MKFLRKTVSVLLAVALACGSMFVAAFADTDEVTVTEYGIYHKADATYHITTAAQIVALAAQCKTKGDPCLTSKYILDEDIDLSGIENAAYTIGDDYPFLGQFDGNGHTISGMTYVSSNSLDTEKYSALFGVVGDENASATAQTADNKPTVKNLIIKGANVQALAKGGIVAREAYNAVFKNISVQDSEVKVRPAGKGLTVITAAGICEGAIAGVAKNVSLYNCESKNTTVYSNSDKGVELLAADEYRLGGLIGEAKGSSIIEYSRVIGGKVSNDLSVSTGVASGFNSYVGGIVGNVGDTTKVLDCYSSAYVIAKSYSVLASGTDDYVGGIIGRVYDKTVSVERCQYDGLIESLTYTTKNENLGGIIGNADIEFSTNRNQFLQNVKSCFYHWENACGKKETPSIPAIVGNDGLSAAKVSNTDEYKSIGKDAYSDPQNFTGYDFDGTTARTTGNEAVIAQNDSGKYETVSHVNPWVMAAQDTVVVASTQTENKVPSDTQTVSEVMPIHGISVNIYSNLNGESEAIDSSNLSGTDPKYILPEATKLSDALSTSTETAGNKTFIGYALVSSANTGAPVLDGLYKAGEALTKAKALEYNTDEKKIYAVWTQIDTVSGTTTVEIDGVKNLRVLTYMNESALSNVGMTADKDYTRGVMFNTFDAVSDSFDNKDASGIQSIEAEANAGTWYGKNYYSGATAEGWNVYSTRAEVDENNYDTTWAFRSYLTFKYADNTPITAYGDFSNTENIGKINSDN